MTEKKRWSTQSSPIIVVALAGQGPITSMDDNGADGAAAAAFASARQNAAAHMLEAAAAAVKKPTAADVDTAGATTNDHDN